MSERLEITALIALLEGDEDCLAHLFEAEILPRGETSFAREEVEVALVARTLVRELEVNWPGVEIILRMREEILATHRQVLELLTELKRRSGDERSNRCG